MNYKNLTANLLRLSLPFIAKNAFCSRDIILQLERSVITLVIIHSTQKKLIHWLL